MIQPLDTCMRTLSALITSDIPAGEAEANACIETYLATFPGPAKQVAALSMLDRAVDQARAVQVAAVRDRGVPRLDRARDDLGQERLVGHVRARVDQDQLDLAAAQLAPQALLELPGRREPGVAPTDDDDAFHHCLL